jgi:hypothetical protein
MRRAAAALLVAAAALAGCRSSEPLAPKAQVDGALSQIGLYCGESTQLLAFGGAHRRMAALDSAALIHAHRLVRIMRSDPSATYLGQSMRRVVNTAAAATAECRLLRTSSTLVHSLSDTS